MQSKHVPTGILQFNYTNKLFTTHKCGNYHRTAGHTPITRNCLMSLTKYFKFCKFAREENIKINLEQMIM